LIVEHQQVAGTGETLGDNVRIVLSADLIEDRRQAARALRCRRIGGAQSPRDMLKLAVEPLRSRTNLRPPVRSKWGA